MEDIPAAGHSAVVQADLEAAMAAEEVPAAPDLAGRDSVVRHREVPGSAVPADGAPGGAVPAEDGADPYSREAVSAAPADALQSFS